MTAIPTNPNTKSENRQESAQSSEQNAVQQQVSQETSMIVAMATRIYEVGATYHPVEPNMYEVTPEDDTNKATLLSAHQFHLTVSLLRTLKSASIMEVQL